MMQVVGISKFMRVLWYFLTINAAFLNIALSEEDSISSDCCIGCTCYVAQSGECSLQYREECNNGTCIFLDFALEASVIEVEVSAEYLQSTTNSVESTTAAATNGSIKLDISEFNAETKEYVLLETRHLHKDESNSRTENYLTRTSKALICVSHETEWSRYNVKLSFREWRYRLLSPEVENPFNPSGEILGQYVPNSVSLYQLPKDPKIKWKGIEITIQGLDIDTENGEYLLIGPGSVEDFPPRFLSQIAEYSMFYVANASAYIEFVSRSIARKHETFKILWNRIGAEMPPSIDPVDTLNAILVCFDNYSRALKEFEEKNDVDEVFPTFREAFAESVRNYTKQKSYCTKSSVKLIGHPTKFKSSYALSILIALECDGKFFKYRELQGLMTHFEQEDQNKTLGYKVGLCPDVQRQASLYNEKLSTLIYALVPTIGLLILLIWAWKNNVFNQKCHPEKEENPASGLETSSIPVEPNTYEATIPKVRLDDGQGRRQTLIQGSPQEDDDEGDNGSAIRVEMNAVPSTSRHSDSLIRVLANRKSKRRPSIQSLMSKHEENVDNEKSDVPKSESLRSFRMTARYRTSQANCLAEIGTDEDTKKSPENMGR